MSITICCLCNGILEALLYGCFFLKNTDPKTQLKKAKKRKHGLKLARILIQILQSEIATTQPLSNKINVGMHRIKEEKAA